MTTKLQYDSGSFELRQYALFYKRFTESAEILVCGTLEVLANVSNPETTKWGKLIGFTNSAHQKKNLVIPMKLVMGSPRDLAAELSFRGLRKINSSRLGMSLLRKYINEFKPMRTIILASRYLLDSAFFVNVEDFNARGGK